jgi:adenine-specific DNA glycosylase
VRVAKTLLLAEKAGRILLGKRNFWELPEADELSEAVRGDKVAEFRHSITNHNYTFTVLRASVKRAPEGFRWILKKELAAIPLSTVTKKALR